MRNIIKEISELERVKEYLIKQDKDEDTILAVDAQINEFIFNVAEYLFIPIKTIGPYLAKIESIASNDSFMFKEKEDDIYHYYYLASQNVEILIHKAPRYTNYERVPAYNVTIIPRMLTFNLKSLRNYPLLKEFIDEYITYTMISEEAFNMEEFYQEFIKESHELKRVKNKNNKAWEKVPYCFFLIVLYYT